MEKKFHYAIIESIESTHETSITMVLDIETAFSYLEEQGYTIFDDFRARKHDDRVGFIVATVDRVPVVG